MLTLLVPSKRLSFILEAIFIICLFISILTLRHSFILLPQAVRNKVQRLHGEDRPDGVCHARPGVRLPPQLLLLLRVRPAAEEGRRVCPEGGPAAVQDRLRAREGPAELGQPGRLGLR